MLFKKVVMMFVMVLFMSLGLFIGLLFVSSKFVVMVVVNGGLLILSWVGFFVLVGIFGDCVSSLLLGKVFVDELVVKVVLMMFWLEGIKFFFSIEVVFSLVYGVKVSLGCVVVFI